MKLRRSGRVGSVSEDETLRSQSTRSRDLQDNLNRMRQGWVEGKASRGADDSCYYVGPDDLEVVGLLSSWRMHMSV